MGKCKSFENSLQFTQFLVLFFDKSFAGSTVIIQDGGFTTKSRDLLIVVIVRSRCLSHPRQVTTAIIGAMECGYMVEVHGCIYIVNRALYRVNCVIAKMLREAHSCYLFFYQFIRRTILWAGRWSRRPKLDLPAIRQYLPAYRRI